MSPGTSLRAAAAAMATAAALGLGACGDAATVESGAVSEDRDSAHQREVERVFEEAQRQIRKSFEDEQELGRG